MYVCVRTGMCVCVCVSVHSFPCSLQVARGQISADVHTMPWNPHNLTVTIMDTRGHAQGISLASTGKSIDGGGEEKGREGGGANKHFDLH